jgi:hypothetical protein
MRRMEAPLNGSPRLALLEFELARRWEVSLAQSAGQMEKRLPSIAGSPSKTVYDTALQGVI